MMNFYIAKCGVCFQLFNVAGDIVDQVSCSVHEETKTICSRECLKRHFETDHANDELNPDLKRWPLE